MNLLIIRTNDSEFKQLLQYADKHIQQIKKDHPNLEVTVIDEIKEEIDKHLPAADILLFSPTDSQLIDFKKAKQLKWAHSTWAGTDDIAFLLKDTSILLTNSSGVHPIPIAEHVFAFMLMFARNINTDYREQIVDKKWTRDSLKIQSISELYQHTIGIVGFGRIGKRITQVAKGFDMNVNILAHKNTIQDKHIDTIYQEDNFEEFLRNSDFIINCLPLTKKTKGFFTLETFKHMKPTAYFINIGRGKTVVEKDLITALKNNFIAGAGLDVFEEEPLPTESELWNLKNVIITPHYAGWTPKYADRVIEIFCVNLKGFLENTSMPNLVDKNRAYI